MKKILLFIGLLLMNQAHAYNAGLICVTYLSKNGELEAEPADKFTRHDLDRVVQQMTKEDPEFRAAISETESVYARGLTSNKSVYKAIYLDGEVYLQNGVFFIDRSQDYTLDMMYRMSKIVGGSSGTRCEPIDDGRQPEWE